MSDSKKTKEQLIEELERFRTLFDNAPLGYQSLDEAGNLVEANDTWCKALGYTRKEVIGKNFAEFLHPDFRKHFKENFPKFKSFGYILGIEFEMIKKDGSEIIVSFDGKIGYNDDGTFKQTHCVLKDVTDRTRAEEALKESEERFRHLTENAQDMIYRMSLPEGQYEYVSPASTNLFGYTPEEFVNSPILIQNAIHPDWRDCFNKQWKALLNGNMPPTYEYQIIHGKTKETRWLHQRNALIFSNEGQPIAIEGIVTDITGRKQAEEAIRTQNLRYYALLKNLNGMVYQCENDKDWTMRVYIPYNEWNDFHLSLAKRQNNKKHKTF